VFDAKLRLSSGTATLVGPQYECKTLGIPMIAGRDFQELVLLVLYSYWDPTSVAVPE